MIAGFSNKIDVEDLGMKLMLQGQVSSGKSWLAASAASAEQEMLWFDFEDKEKALRTHPCRRYIHVKTYKDVAVQQGEPPKPTAFSDFLLDLGKLEYEKKLGKLPKMFFCLDSLKFLEMAALRYFLHLNPAARKTLNINGTKINSPYGWDGYRDSVAAISEGVIPRLFALGDTIVIAHERAEEDPTSDETDKKKRLTGRYTLDPPRINFLKSLFNDKYRIAPPTYAGGKYKVHVASNDEFLGACTFFGVSAEEEADLKIIFRKHKEWLAKNMQVQQPQSEKPVPQLQAGN